MDDAADAASIDRATLYRWIERGEGAKSGEYSDFCDRLNRARARGKVAMVKAIRKAGDKDWRANAHILACRYPEEWSEKRIIEATIKAVQTIEDPEAWAKQIMELAPVAAELLGLEMEIRGEAPE